jgi:hypothetical protein
VTPVPDAVSRQAHDVILKCRGSLSLKADCS